MIVDYYFIATILLGFACVAAAPLRHPCGRVAVIRAVFLAILLLPAMMLVPGRERVSCNVFETPRGNENVTLSTSATIVDAKTQTSDGKPPERSFHGEIATPQGKAAAPCFSMTPANVFVTFQLFGMFGVAVRLGLGYFRTRRLLRGSVVAEGRFATRCRVRIHPQLAAPIIVGVWSPTILIPETQDENEIRCAIAHENAHWENGDLRGLAVERLLMFPLWFHPFFWLLRRSVHRDRETLADLRAVEKVDRLAYIEQLLAWARRALKYPLPGGVFVLGIAEEPSRHSRHRNPFSRRITMLLNETATLKVLSRRRRVVLFASLTLVVLSAATLTLQTLPLYESDPDGVMALRESLKQIAPTPTEKVAIKRLRADVLAEYNNKDNIAQKYIASEMSETNDEQIAVEHHILSIRGPLAKVILADPSLSWSGLVVPERNTMSTRVAYHTEPDGSKVNGQTRAEPGYCQLTHNVPLPLQARLFGCENARNFLEIFTSGEKANCLQAPKFTLFSGQTGTIQDVTQTPFVTSVLPVEGDSAVAYQPIIQIFDEGSVITTKVTLLEDHSCRLDYCSITLSRVEKIDIVKLRDDPPVNPHEKSGVSLQAPTVKTMNVTIPPVTIPEGMSLLVAAPGLFRDSDDEGVFVLVTPRRVTPKEECTLGHVSSWDEFWDIRD